MSLFGNPGRATDLLFEFSQLAIWNDARCSPAMFTAPMKGEHAAPNDRVARQGNYPGNTIRRKENIARGVDPNVCESRAAVVAGNSG